MQIQQDPIKADQDLAEWIDKYLSGDVTVDALAEWVESFHWDNAMIKAMDVRGSTLVRRLITLQTHHDSLERGKIDEAQFQEALIYNRAKLRGDYRKPPEWFENITEGLPSVRSFKISPN